MGENVDVNDTDLVELSDAIEGSVSEFWLDVIKYVNDFGAPVINSSGILFNMLGMVTLLQMRLKTTTLAFMFYLMLIDVIANIYGLVFDGLLLFGINFLHYGRVVCKLGIWIFYFAVYTPNISLVLFTLDRVFAATAPFKYRLLKKRVDLALYSCITATCAMLLITSANLYMFDTNVANQRCVDAAYVPERWSKIYHLATSVIIYSIAPIILILVFNLVIIFSLRCRQSAVKKSNNEKDMTVTLLSMSFFFIFMVILSLMANTYGRFYVVPKKGYAAYLFRRLTLIPLALARSSDFLFYFIGGRVFRQGFYQVVAKLTRKPIQKAPTQHAKSNTGDS